MKKRKFPKEKHDLIRILRNWQRKNENKIRLEIKQAFESSRTRFVAENNDSENV